MVFLYGILQPSVIHLKIEVAYMGFYLLLFGLIFYKILSFPTNIYPKITTSANIVSLILILFVVLSLINGGFSRPTKMEKLWGDDYEFTPMVEGEITKPDIYYIIVDSYPRADTLSSQFGIDGDKFVQELKKRGFYVAPESRSNYCWTYLSLASSLNFTYLDSLVSQMNKKSPNRAPLIKMIEDNRVISFLKNIDYSLVAFSSGYTGTDMHHADYFISPEGFLKARSEFSIKLFNQTLFKGFYNIYAKLFKTKKEVEAESSGVYNGQMRDFFVLQKMPSIASLASPKFVFAHLLSIHPTTDTSFYLGSPAKEKAYLESYFAHMKEMNMKILQMVDGILSNSQTKPIIILQGDHGPDFRGNILGADSKIRNQNRLSILNALYLPGDGKKIMYPGITPVNTFRKILNYYFNQKLKILEDKGFISEWRPVYVFTRVF